MPGKSLLSAATMLCFICTGFDKGRLKSLSVLRKAGFANIETETIPNMRHEILNETEHQKVYERILQFMMRK